MYQNPEWLAAAKETLNEAIEDRNFSFARDVALDIEQADFGEEAAKAFELIALEENKK